ncbi:ATP-dependent helicase C-terminal domain-containing protein [Nonomuraea sp. NPDC049152]|uniref:ATP-dependent RNA helicase n=1 Tax=Nonomuraea sp. NPDC049152 TaxID=3154350 RepID=UPI0033FEB6BD
MLPIHAALPSLLRALDDGGRAVLTAPPGTGKTTVVPLALAEAGLRVLVAEPRRLAVRAAARRMDVAYTIRGEHRQGRRPGVEVVTTGVLLQRLQRDQELPGVDLVMIDECHERHLDADTALAFLIDVRETLRPDLRLVAASATADTAPWSRLLGDAPVISASGVAHPVEIVWAPPPRPVAPPHGLRVDPALLAHVADVVRRALAEREGDVLCFLPGVGEISRVAGMLGTSVDVLQVHGQAPAHVQDAVLRPAPDRRVVLAPSVAESSLTVPGVRVVVDSGLAREPRTDHARGLGSLTTVHVSRASADQRAGRAGREGPGTVYRCWTAATHARLAPQAPPEILLADLTGFALQAACWGSPDASDLALLDRPPAAAMSAATRTLRGLGAVEPLDGDSDEWPPETGTLAERPTRHRAPNQRPSHDRVPDNVRPAGGSEEATSDGRTVGDGSPGDRPQETDGPEGVLVGGRPAGGSPTGGSPVEEVVRRRVRVTDRGRRMAAAGVHPRLARALLDAGPRAAEVVALLSDQLPRDAGDDLVDIWRKAARERDPRWLREVKRLTGARIQGPDDEAAGLAVAMAFPERVARRSGGGYLMSSGTRAQLPEGSRLGTAEWLAIAVADRPTGAASARIRQAVVIDEDLARRVVPVTVQKEVAWRRGDVSARVVERLGAIELSVTPLKDADVRPALLYGLRTENVLTWTREALAVRDRMAFCHRAIGDPWPSMDDLIDLADQWLEPELSRARRRADLERLDVAGALRRLVPWSRRLDDDAPSHIEVPSGSRIRVDYSGEQPVLAVKLQELFGWQEAPRVSGVPLLIHLLSPAGRPAAVTSDLASFWRNGYRAVRAELRGRYPKHPWPEDPLTAPPTRRTKPR